MVSSKSELVFAFDAYFEAQILLIEQKAIITPSRTQRRVNQKHPKFLTGCVRVSVLPQLLGN